ncbi:hypothetical protein ACFL6C_08845 [Myxococcota bacterium]
MAHLVLHGVECRDFDDPPVVHSELHVSVQQTCLLGSVEAKQVFRVLVHVGNATGEEVEIENGTFVDGTGAEFGIWAVEENSLDRTEATLGAVVAIFDFRAQIPPRPWTVRVTTTDGREVLVPGSAF